MDPRFNQQPTQPYQPAAPIPGQPSMPAQPAAQPTQPVYQPTQYQVPVQSAVPTQPYQPASTPAQPPMPAQPYTQPTPVPAQSYTQPVYTAQPEPVQPYAQPAPSAPQPTTQFDYSEQGMGIENAYEGVNIQSNPYLAESVVPSMNDTEPITERDPLPEPDPIAEALKAPIQAAAPVPGSIGSNTTMLKSKQAKGSQPMISAQPKKRNPVLTILIIISILAIFGLGFILVMQLYPDLLNFGSSNNPTPPTPTIVRNYLTCERTLKSSELLNYSNAISGTETFDVDYENNEIVKIVSQFELKYENTSNANIGSDKLRSDYVNSFKKLDYTTDPFKSNYNISENVLTVLHEAVSSEIDKTNMSMFNLSLAKDGTINTPIDTLNSTYTKLGFTCKNE